MTAGEHWRAKCVQSVESFFLCVCLPWKNKNFGAGLGKNSICSTVPPPSKQIGVNKHGIGTS